MYYAGRRVITLRRDVRSPLEKRRRSCLLLNRHGGRLGVGMSAIGSMSMLPSRGGESRVMNSICVGSLTMAKRNAGKCG